MNTPEHDSGWPKATAFRPNTRADFIETRAMTGREPAPA